MESLPQSQEANSPPRETPRRDLLKSAGLIAAGVLLVPVADRLTTDTPATEPETPTPTQAAEQPTDPKLIDAQADNIAAQTEEQRADTRRKDSLNKQDIADRETAREHPWRQWWNPDKLPIAVAAMGTIGTGLFGLYKYTMARVDTKTAQRRQDQATRQQKLDEARAAYEKAQNEELQRERARISQLTIKLDSANSGDRARAAFDLIPYTRKPEYLSPLLDIVRSKLATRRDTSYDPNNPTAPLDVQGLAALLLATVAPLRQAAIERKREQYRKELSGIPRQMGQPTLLQQRRSAPADATGPAEDLFLHFTPVIDISGSGLDGVRLEGADLSVLTLAGSHFKKAVLTSVTLQGSDLRSGDFTSADLRGANLAHANLAFTTLEGADLSGADLTGIDWKHVPIETVKSVLGARIYGTKGLSQSQIDRLAERGADVTERADYVSFGETSPGDDTGQTAPALWPQAVPVTFTQHR